MSNFLIQHIQSRNAPIQFNPLTLVSLSTHVCTKCTLIYMLVLEYSQGFSAILTGFRVWIYTVPGPVNLHTRPSPEASPDIIPPDATRSMTYFVFQAIKCPLSTMYFSPSTSCFHISGYSRYGNGVGYHDTYVFLDDGTKAEQPEKT